MEFNWDLNKANTNIEKHDVSFEEASSVFADPYALRIFDPDHSDDEDRYLLLGLSSSARLLVLSHCYRNGDILVRIISARKATKTESNTYARRK